MRNVVLVAAVSRNRVIGLDGRLPFQVPEDLRRFREMTENHAVVMGRKTWESLPRAVRPLPGRKNIVVSRSQNLAVDAGVSVTGSIELGLIHPDTLGKTVFVIGGGDIYAQTLALAERIELTEIDTWVEGQGLVFFPSILPSLFRATTTGKWMRSTSGLHYRFITFERTNPT